MQRCGRGRSKGNRMYSRFARLMLRSIVGGFIGTFMFVSAGLGQQSSTAVSSGGTELSEAQLQCFEQQFLANPQQFLAQNFTDGGANLASLIARIASNPDHLQAIISAFAVANPNQLTSIGGGLAQAASGANSDVATQIQTVVNAAAAAGYWQVSSGALRSPIGAVNTSCSVAGSCGGTQIISPH
jgi:uncharacterized circularly permuted ATP-grasp superfamily protein